MSHMVSVIINCHNGEKFLRETLNSLKIQNFTDFEVIFWDNCSDDLTPIIAKQFDERLKYYRNEEFAPLGEMRNKALSVASGKYIAFLDSDDLWDKRKLQIQVDYLEEHPSVGMMLTNFKIYNMLNEIEVPSNNPKTDLHLSFEKLLCDYRYCLSTYMIRKTALDELESWFDPNLQYVEEYDLFARIAYRWKTFYSSEVLTTYRIHHNMNSIRLSDKKPEEYLIVLGHLREYIEGFDSKYPNVVCWLLYISSLFLTKTYLSKGENSSARVTIKPYVKYNYRARVFYLFSFLPGTVSKRIYKLFYKTHM